MKVIIAVIIIWSMTFYDRRTEPGALETAVESQGHDLYRWNRPSASGSYGNRRSP
jgi:hypothetical protein